MNNETIFPYCTSYCYTLSYLLQCHFYIHSIYKMSFCEVLAFKIDTVFGGWKHIFTIFPAISDIYRSKSSCWVWRSVGISSIEAQFINVKAETTMYAVVENLSNSVASLKHADTFSFTFICLYEFLMYDNDPALLALF